MKKPGVRRASGSVGASNDSAPPPSSLSLPGATFAATMPARESSSPAPLSWMCIVTVSLLICTLPGAVDVDLVMR